MATAAELKKLLALVEQETETVRNELEQLQWIPSYENIRLYLDGYRQYKAEQAELQVKIQDFQEALDFLRQELEVTEEREIQATEERDRVITTLQKREAKLLKRLAGKLEPAKEALMLDELSQTRTKLKEVVKNG